MKKILLGALFSIMLSGMLLSTFNIQSAKAAGTIYINADGSISPSDAPVSSFDNIVYRLTANTDGSIVVERSNIVVEGAGHTVQGDGTGNGFTLNDVINVTVRHTRIEGCFTGIQLFNSSGSTITGNTINDSSYEGVGVYYSSEDIITENNVTNNQIGITFYDSSNNSIFHNSFATNAYQVYTESSVNYWDNGYPSGGNYWNDYTGSDFYSGPYQNETGSDGIGDTLYTIDSTNTDEYPLMQPYLSHDITIIDIKPSKTIVGQGFSMEIDVYAMNMGSFNETTMITLYVNDTPTVNSSASLQARELITIQFICNTKGFAKGNYTISAYASPVPGEADTADNTLVDGWVVVAIAGDLTGPTGWPDGKVDMRDIAYVAKRFGTTPANPSWNSNADITGRATGVPDGKVDMKDISAVAKNFGKKDP